MEPIQTPRLVIRPFREDDGKGLFAYLSDSEVVRFEPYGVHTEEESIKEAANRAANPDFHAVCLLDGTLIGNLYFSKGDFDTWELGYVFNRHYWGHGYASESATAIMEHAFAHRGARRIIALCNVLNEPSWKLLERIGMRHEGTYRKISYFKTDADGQPIWQDAYSYAILKDEFNMKS